MLIPILSPANEPIIQKRQQHFELYNNTNSKKRKASVIDGSKVLAPVSDLADKAESHRMSEQRRRDKVNGQLASLKKVLPASRLKKQKVDKATTISLAVEYILELQERISQLEGKTSESSASPSVKPEPLDTPSTSSLIEGLVSPLSLPHDLDTEPLSAEYLPINGAEDDEEMMRIWALL